MRRDSKVKNEHIIYALRAVIHRMNLPYYSSKKKKKKETAIKPEELNFSSTRQARGCDHAKFTVSLIYWR